MPISAEREVFQIKEIEPVKPSDLLEANLYDEDLSFNGFDTQHSMHAIHPYIAAMNPPLARKLIQTYVPEPESVLDPYCGGGGVLLESTLLGRENAGGDINPLGVLISKAKTTYISPRIIEMAYKNILSLSQKLTNQFSIHFDRQLNYWFKEYTIPQIDSLAKATNKVTNDDLKLKNLFHVILSASIRDVMLTYRGEVRLRRLQGDDLEKFNPDIYKAFAKRYTIAVERIDTLPPGCESNIEIRDIKNLSFDSEQFHSIICSPPYADDKNGVGYFQFSKNMLAWLGFAPDDIKKHKDLFLGAEKNNKISPESESLAISLENINNRNTKHYKEAVAFYHDYDLGLKEMVRVTKKWIIIVIGNRVLSRTQFNNAQITVDLLNNHGVELKHHYTRELRKKRMMNLGNDGGGISKEHILVFKK
ncbi:MAG: hypothetical protein FVQ77_07035 [Cytophagales bacterium]|nr:hypothetical protein [Cytophagales bacterium]